MSDFFQNLREERDERVSDLHLDLPIPTWDGGLVARFDIGSRKEVEKYARSKRTVETDCDFLSHHVRELYALDRDKLVEGAERMAENPDYVRVENDAGTPVKFDVELMQKMGVGDVASNSREVQLYLVKNNGVVLMGLAGRLLTWMQNTDAKVADDLVGEA